MYTVSHAAIFGCFLLYLVCLFFLPIFLHQLSRALDISVHYQVQWPANLKCA